MRKLLVVISLVVEFSAHAQFPIYRHEPARIIKDQRLPIIENNLWCITSFADTASAPDYYRKVPGIVMMIKRDSTFWIRNQTCNRWIKIGSGISN